MPAVVGALAIEGIALASAETAAAITAISIAGVSGATILGTGIILAGTIGIQALLSKNAGNQSTSGLASGSANPAENGHVPIRQSIAPRIVAFGRARLAGTYVLFEEKNGDSYDITVFHHGRIFNIVGYYLHDDVVERVGGTVQEQGDGRYANDVIYIEARLGVESETSYGPAVTALPEIWTSGSHLGNGLASALLICHGVSIDAFTQVYPRGLPQLSIIADCTPVYDPRDETQSVDNDGTWTSTSNPVLQLVRFLTDADIGMGFERSILIDPVIEALNAQADVCDEPILLADGGIEPRYASNGFFSLDTDPVNVIAGILDTCDGWISEDGAGGLVCVVGKYREPEFTIPSRHVRGFTIQDGIADEELVNEITFSYTEPLADYKTLPGQPWRDEENISARGKTRSQPFDMPWVQSHSQGRRLSKRKLAKVNAPLRGSIKTTLYGLQGLGERWITIDAVDVDGVFDGLVAEVQGMKIDLINAQVTFDWISVDPDTIDEWNAATEQGAAPTIPDKLVSPPPPLPTGLAANMQAISGTQISIVCKVDDPVRSDITYQAQYRITGSGSPFTQLPRQSGTLTSGRVKTVFLTSISSSFVPAYTLDVEIRAFAPSGSPSAFTSAVVAPFDAVDPA
jgi:hypothetical protein